MPLYNPSGLPVGAGAGPYTAGYSSTNRALPSYTANVENTTFSGGLLDLLQAARLTDLNAVRVALENLRVFSEAAAQNHNALVADLKAMGILS